MTLVCHWTLHKQGVIGVCGSLIQYDLLLKLTFQLNLLFLLDQSNSELVIAILERLWCDVADIPVNEHHQILVFLSICVETHGLILLQILFTVCFQDKVET